MNTPEFLQKALPIKAVIFDVDGVLTDGGIIYDNNRMEYKKFNAKDGFICKLLRQEGYIVGAITGRNSPVVMHRLDELLLHFHFHGASQKIQYYNEIKQKYSLKDEEIAYIGDDMPDLPILGVCGLSATPADAPAYIQSRVAYVCQKKGGEGALREFVDLILTAQGRLEGILKKYLPT